MSSAVADAPRRPLSFPQSWRRPMQILGWVFTLLVVVGWVMFLRPQNLGGPAAYVMVSGESMEPTYETGDFVVARALDSYDVGDVMVYRVPERNAGAGRLIIHRVIGGDMESGFITQGDNRATPDQWRPVQEDIVGKLWFHIPNAATVLPYLRSPIALATFFGLLTFLYIVTSDDKKKEESEGEETAAESEPTDAPRAQAQPEAPVAIEATTRSDRVGVLTSGTISVREAGPDRSRAYLFLGAGLAAAAIGYLWMKRSRS